MAVRTTAEVDARVTRGKESMRDRRRDDDEILLRK